MDIYYTHTSGWEIDYFKNDIFNQSLYNYNINFILFDTNTLINNINNYNIIVINRGISCNFAEYMIQKIKPFIVFHLSDERGKDLSYYNLYIKYNIKLLFHQYNFKEIKYKIDHFQIPLGYVSNFLSNKSSININNNIVKKYDFAFIGTLKSDRNVMINKFQTAFKNNIIHIGNTNWSNPMDQHIVPNKMYDIYKESLFIPIGRGNSSLDCFRIYEAIVAGAIPVIVGTIDEINNTFYFNNDMPKIIIGNNWDDAVTLCKNIYTKYDKLKDIINFNNKWWTYQIKNISNKINQLIEIQ